MFETEEEWVSLFPGGRIWLVRLSEMLKYPHVMFRFWGWRRFFVWLEGSMGERERAREYSLDDLNFISGLDLSQGGGP